MGKYIDAHQLKAEMEKHIKEIKDAAKRFMPNLGFFDAKLSGIYDVMAIIDSSQQEQPEKKEVKFVFPKFLYARTTNNKTIDVSYAPQSLDAVEYIKNDPTEQPEVDLEKEIEQVVEKYNSLANGGMVMKPSGIEKIARHFYELGKNSK